MNLKKAYKFQLLIAIVLIGLYGCKQGNFMAKSNRLMAEQSLIDIPQSKKNIQSILEKDNLSDTIQSEINTKRILAFSESFPKYGHHNGPFIEGNSGNPLVSPLEMKHFPDNPLNKEKILKQHRTSINLMRWGAGITVFGAAIFTIFLATLSDYMPFFIGMVGLGGFVIGLVGILLLIIGTFLYFKTTQDLEELKNETFYKKHQANRLKFARLFFKIGIVAFVLSVIGVFLLNPNFVILSGLLIDLVTGACVILFYGWVLLLAAALVLWLLYKIK